MQPFLSGLTDLSGQQFPGLPDIRGMLKPIFWQQKETPGIEIQMKEVG